MRIILLLIIVSVFPLISSCHQSSLAVSRLKLRGLSGVANYLLSNLTKCLSKATLDIEMDG